MLYTSRAAIKPAIRPAAPTPLLTAPAVGIDVAGVVETPPVGMMLVELDPVGYNTVVLGVMTGTELLVGVAMEVLSHAHGAVTVTVMARQVSLAVAAAEEDEATG